MNILNSSAFRPFGAPLEALHPVREMGCKLGRGATAVICNVSSERLPFATEKDFFPASTVLRPRVHLAPAVYDNLKQPLVSNNNSDNRRATGRSLIRRERDEGEIWRRLAEGAIRDLRVCRVLVRVS